VIAEGIEDRETLRFLQTIDHARLELDLVIQGGQGYGLGRPSPQPSATMPAIFRSLTV
jgi:EAL domain-containing protein (putative c-di-GMP-specific phosphodiesterase class I)